MRAQGVLWYGIRMWKSFQELETQLKTSLPNTLVVAAAHDPYVLQAVFHAANIVPMQYALLGNKKRILDIARNIGRELNDASIFHMEGDEQCFFAALEMVQHNKGHALMCGAIERSRFLSLLQVHAKHRLSSLALLETPAYHKPIAVTDVEMYAAPSLREKEAILKNAICLHRHAGTDAPRVAAIVPFEDKAHNASAAGDMPALVVANDKGIFGECLLEGLMPLETAFSMDAAAGEGVYGEVAGNADILLMPGLAAGAVFCKALSFLGGATLGGCVLGAPAPVVWPTRSAGLEEAVRSIMLCLGSGAKLPGIF